MAVMALERVPADIRRNGGVARMSDPEVGGWEGGVGGVDGVLGLGCMGGWLAGWVWLAGWLAVAGWLAGHGLAAEGW